MTKICLAGDGWGALAAYDGVKDCYENIEVVTNDPELISRLKLSHKKISDFSISQAKIFICAGYKPIIKKEILDSYDFINIHYSLLPKYRGLHSTVWAILNDEDYLGLTIHQMNEYIDDGPIIYQYAIENDGIQTSTWYMNHFNRWIQDNLNRIVQEYLSKKIVPINQDINLATWVGKRSISDCKIDFSKDFKFLKNFFRALSPPYPQPYVLLKKSNKTFKILEVEFVHRRIITHIGRILNIDRSGVYVSSKEGYVKLKSIKDENDKMVEFSNFKIGEFLDQSF